MKHAWHRTGMRLVLAGLGTLLSLLALLGFSAYLLVFTEAGSRWLLDQTLSRTPALKIQEVRGTLASRLTFRQLAWRQDDLEVRIEAFTVQGDPTCLWRMTLCLSWIQAEGIEGRSSDTATASSAPVQQLPKLLWPMRIEASAVNVEQIRWRSGESEVAPQRTVDLIRFSAVAQGRRLTLSDLVVELPGHRVSGALELRTAANWTLESSLDLQSVTPAALKAWIPEQRMRLQISSSGPLDALAITASLAGSLPASARLVTDLLAASPTLEGDVEVPAFSLQAEAFTASLRDVRIRAAGSAAKLQFEAVAALHQASITDGPTFPRGGLSMKGRWENRALPDLKFSYVSDDGAHALQWQGAVTLEDAAQQASGTLSVRSDRLATWAPEVDGKLRASTLVQARLHGDELTFRLEKLLIEGAARGETFSGTAAMEGRSAPDGLLVRLDQTILDVGPARLRAAGAVLPSVDLRGQLEIPRLSDLQGEARGNLHSGFHMSGEPASPVISFSASVSEPGWQGYSAATLAATGSITTMGQPGLDLQLEASGLSGLPEQLPLTHARLHASGTPEAVQLRLDADGTGSVVQLLTRVFPGEPETRIAIEVGELRAPVIGAWQFAGPASLRWDAARSSLLVETDTCLNGAASLCLLGQSRLFAGGDVTHLRMTGIGEKLWVDHLPPGLTIQADFAGNGKIIWTEAEPQVQIALLSGAGHLELAGNDETPAVAHTFEKAELHGSVDAESIITRLALQSNSLGEVEARLQMARATETLAGSFRVNGFRFAPLRPLLPGVEELLGRLDADIEISGSRQVPVLNGLIRVADARARGAMLPLEVYDLRMDARLSGEQLAFDGSFSTREEKRNGNGANSFSGAARFDGDASWAEAARQLNLNMTGSELQVQVGGHTSLVLDAGLVAHVTPDLLDAKGQARIRQGLIRLPRQGADAVWLADDVVLIPAPPVQDPPKPLPFSTVRTALDIDLGEQLSFSGHGIEGWLGGNLQVINLHTPEPRGQGTIEIRDGRYRAYGQRLTLRQGRLRFRNDLFDPSLDIEAIRPLDQVVVGVRVKGPASEPEVGLFSEPSMPEEEILSWLILGKPLGSGSAQDSQMLSSALLSYSLRSGEEQGAKLAERLGINQFEIGTGEVGDNAGVFASGYLSPRLFVRYGVSSAVAANSLTLRYRVLPKLFLEASSELETAVDLLYSISF